MSGGLSTHVLDLARGRPAAGLKVVLRQDGETLFTGDTNADGRCPAILGSSPLTAGAYQLVFDVAGYFIAQGSGEPPFFSVVTIDFTVSDPDSHHHVPLLLSPYGYSTYRGS